MIPPKLQKRIGAVRNKDKSKRRARATSPMRMTSCIFKSSVTRITSHPENTTRHRQEEMLEKPQQLCAFRRLQKYCIEDGTGNLLGPLCFSNPAKRTARGRQAGAIVPSGVNGVHTAQFTSVQSPRSEGTVREALEQSPSPSYSQGVTGPMALELSPSINIQQVTPADIRRQSRRVMRARRRLAAALELDRIARQEENMEESPDDDEMEEAQVESVSMVDS
ncbi:methyl-CpG-binding domain protein 3-like 2B [Arvicola amphibius]|uniref:methyl-CpG-binding domain protein 3-like 2B n=1 Tax=Arvicola amphibius TaxID=1047088 RepID=UPI0018E3123B|nr:methyl-CpG-binding domain protein 3-like 2B [Arvicola amphibius]